MDKQKKLKLVIVGNIIGFISIATILYTRKKSFGFSEVFSLVIALVIIIIVVIYIRNRLGKNP
jgi:hypothetical protein